ncbi:MAG: WXG100 family type VII secretion target [Agathobacter sp.]|nr:WXG100 family type VII secretion target [Agathobacter sp.]
MSEMGSTGAIVMTKEMLTNAINAISTYQSTITSLNGELDTVITGLVSNSWTGDAATGFQTFYTNNIEKNLGENLSKMLKSLQQVCEGIRDAIPADSTGVDAKLGENNKGSGSSEGK